MAEKKVKKEELKKDFLKTMAGLEKAGEVEKMIKDNRIAFRINDVDYRVRKPNHAEQMDIEKFRRKKYLELMDDDSMMFRKQWVEKYKTKGIDIDAMEKEIVQLQNNVEALLLRLATSTNKKDIEKLKSEIVELKDKQAGLNIEKTDLLSYSIEDQLTIQVNAYYAYSVVEVRKEEKWVKLFKTYEDFANCKDTDLMNKIFYYVNYLIYTLPF